jgi:hypothetical protein
MKGKGDDCLPTASNRLRSVSDLPLTWEEDQDISLDLVSFGESVDEPPLEAAKVWEEGIVR